MPLDVARRGTLDVKDPPLKAIVADAETYEEGYHAGNLGGLSAIDTDLAAGNIKQAITIFGKLGTFVSTLAHDLQQDSIKGGGEESFAVEYTKYWPIPSGGDVVFLARTPTFDANSWAEVFLSGAFGGGHASSIKVRLYVDGTQRAESGFVMMPSIGSNAYTTAGLDWNGALSGAIVIEGKFHNYHASLSSYGYVARGAALFAGSVKLI